MRFLVPLLVLLVFERAVPAALPPAAALAGGAGAHGAALASALEAAPYAASDSPATVVASPRRPGPEVLALHSSLDRALAVPGWRGDHWSVLAVSLDRGDTLYAREPGLALTPASNMKLFTSAAALHYLGAEFRYATYLLAGGRIADGVLDGDLVLYGTGDPTLSNRFLPGPGNVFEPATAHYGLRGGWRRVPRRVTVGALATAGGLALWRLRRR
jgi:D-alanyl-D-alanine carboxypeptidase